MLSGDFPPLHTLQAEFFSVYACKWIPCWHIKRNSRSSSSESLTPENGFFKSMRKVWEGIGELLGAPPEVFWSQEEEKEEGLKLYGVAGLRKTEQATECCILFCAIWGSKVKMKFASCFICRFFPLHTHWGAGGRQGSRSKRFSATWNTCELHRAYIILQLF